MASAPRTIAVDRRSTAGRRRMRWRRGSRSARRHGSVAPSARAASPRSTRPSGTPIAWCCGGTAAGEQWTELCVRRGRPGRRRSPPARSTAAWLSARRRCTGCELLVLGPAVDGRGRSEALGPARCKWSVTRPGGAGRSRRRRGGSGRSLGRRPLGRRRACARAPRRAGGAARRRSAVRPYRAASASARWWPPRPPMDLTPPGLWPRSSSAGFVATPIRPATTSCPRTRWSAA